MVLLRLVSDESGDKLERHDVLLSWREGVVEVPVGPAGKGADLPGGEEEHCSEPFAARGRIFF